MGGEGAGGGDKVRCRGEAKHHNREDGRWWHTVLEKNRKGILRDKGKWTKEKSKGTSGYVRNNICQLDQGSKLVSR